MNETILQLCFSDFPKHPETGSSDSDFELFELDPSPVNISEHLDDDELKEDADVDDTEILQQNVCDSNEEDVTTFERDSASELKEVDPFQAENVKNDDVASLELSPPSSEDEPPHEESSSLHGSQLDKDIHRYYESSKPSPAMDKALHTLLNDMETLLYVKLEQKIVLRLFGSRKTGLGTCDSEIDVFIQLESKDLINFNLAEMPMKLLQIYGVLRESEIFKPISFVPYNQAPIIKCKSVKSFQMSLNISCYNKFYMDSTRLLEAYCRLEPKRLPQLAYWVKRWASDEGGIIKDSMGLINSFGCTLLLIQYLQQCVPPVLPSLEDFKEADDFLENKPANSQNEQSIGELFLGFLDYFAKFDYQNQVVQIRRKEPVIKKEKATLVNSKHKLPSCFGNNAWDIEDPFEPNRNVCNLFAMRRDIRTAISQKIKQNFVNAAEKFKAYANPGAVAASEDETSFSVSQLDDVIHIDYEKFETSMNPGALTAAEDQTYKASMNPGAVAEEEIAFSVSHLDGVIHRNYEVLKPSPEMDESVTLLIDKLQNFLTEKLGKQVRLDIFGSLKNGFGSSDSDIDACLQFSTATKPKNWKTALYDLKSKMDHSAFAKLCVDVVRSESKNDARFVMPTVAAHLRASSFVCTAQAITSAKVPIVKCEILEPLKISMDICYDNTLALENTKLLAAYCQWEPDRLPQLGLWVKTWAKKSGICNSSEGYFSSYGCILLLIHFLQNCDPRVLPCLQEGFERSETLHFSGWNTYFYSKVEPDWSQNRQSVGRLFLGFLEYYANFDYRTEIVQIRRKEILTKEEKTEAEKKWTH